MPSALEVVRVDGLVGLGRVVEGPIDSKRRARPPTSQNEQGTNPVRELVPGFVWLPNQNAGLTTSPGIRLTARVGEIVGAPAPLPPAEPEETSD